MSKNLSWNAINFRVELKGSNRIFCSCNLEVHITKGIFGPKDVGESYVFTFGVNKAHSDARYVTSDRHTGIH